MQFRSHKRICYRKIQRSAVICSSLATVYFFVSFLVGNGVVDRHISEDVTPPYFARRGSFVQGFSPGKCGQFTTRNPEAVPSLGQYYCDILRYCHLEERGLVSTSIPYCSCLPDTLHGPLNTNLTDLLSSKWSDLEYLSKYVLPGGHWKPAHCAARRRISVIIPYRDRERHLRAFLAHYHPILQRQQLEYQIFVVEQTLPYVFNKASLMNAGFLEAQKAFPADCVLFIDVDTMAERDDNIAICGDRPVHWAAYVNRTRYEHIRKHFGAAVLLTADQFRRVNGYSNVFWGWGGEDDNFLDRILQKLSGFDVGPREISRYTLFEHDRDETFQKNSLRYTMTGYAKKHPKLHSQEGLNTVNYRLVSFHREPLYTKIMIELLDLNLSKMPFSPFKSLVEISYKSQVKYRKGNQFILTTGRCARQRDVPLTRHFKSFVTCKFLCDLKKDGRVCLGLEYHEEAGADSFCVLLERGCTIVDKEKAGLTVHMVANHLSSFSNTCNVTHTREIARLRSSTDRD